MTARVRRATTADAEAIADVHIATWNVAYRGQLPGDFLARLAERRPERIAIWMRAIASGNTRVFVAERDRRIVGLVSVGPPEGEPQPGEGVGELYAIYVHPDAWDTGAGRDLMHTALDELRAIGYQEATLWVLDSNERARRFYERGGWRLDGATKVDRRGDVELNEVRYRVSLADDAR